MSFEANQVNALIAGGRSVEAIKLVIKDANGIGRKHQQRDQVAGQLLKVLLSVKASEIEAVVKELELDEIDVLMKFIYYGFENAAADVSGAHLLTWHDKACERGGVGSIVRVLTEH